jgi:hypothetical protein
LGFSGSKATDDLSDLEDQLFGEESNSVGHQERANISLVVKDTLPQIAFVTTFCTVN